MLSDGKPTYARQKAHEDRPLRASDDILGRFDRRPRRIKHTLPHGPRSSRQCPAQDEHRGTQPVKDKDDVERHRHMRRAATLVAPQTCACLACSAPGAAAERSIAPSAPCRADSHRLPRP